jgi:uncharacterized membrane-anchored protein
MTTILKWAFVIAMLLTTEAWAAPDPTAADASRASVQKFLEQIEYKTGEIEIGDKLAKLNVPESFRYVGPKDAEKILRLWGNPPGGNPPLGMLFPAGKTPASDNSWAVVIEWSGDGYVKDDDAEKIDYAALLKDMQKATREANQERTKSGYQAIELVGWATAPRYDSKTHKMYWAKDITFGGEPAHVLNYNIRILGRKGVLVLNAVAGLGQLNEIETVVPQILAMVNFNAGNRYADFKPDSDKMAAYGLAALVAGGIAAKAGLFKGLIVLILAAKKFIVLGVIGLITAIKKFLGRNKATT